MSRLLQKTPLYSLMIAVLPVIAASTAISAVFGPDTSIPPPAASSAPRIAPDAATNLSEQARRALDLAAQTFAAGQFHTTESILRGILTEEPDQPDALYLLGLTLANLDRPEEAIEALRASAKGYSVNAAPLVVLGDVLLSLDRTEEGKSAFEAAVARDPTNFVALESLAVIAEKTGSIEDAMTYLERAIEVSIPARLYPRLHLARIALSARDGARAIEGLQESHYRDDAPEIAISLAALAYELNGNLDLARAQYRKLLDLYAAPASYLRLARLEISDAQFDTAEQVLLNAAEQFSSDPAMRAEIGALLGGMQRYDRAMEIFAAGLSDTPDHLGLLRGARLTEARRGNTAEALNHAARVTRLNGSATADLVWLAILQERAGDATAASDSYRRVLDANPDNIVALNNLAVLQMPTDPEGAVALAERARTQAPDATDVQDTLGQAYIQAGRPAEAVAVFAALVAQDPGNAMAALRHGQALLEQGNAQKGHTEVRRALTLDKDLADTDLGRALLARP